MREQKARVCPVRRPYLVKDFTSFPTVVFWTIDALSPPNPNPGGQDERSKRS